MPEIPLGEFTPGAARAEMPDAGGDAETSFSTLPDDVAGDAETSFITPPDDETSVGTLYDQSIRDGNAIDIPVDVHVAAGTSLDTPSTEPGDNIQNLQDGLRAAELAAAKTNLVKEFYQSIKTDYEGLPLPKKIPYDQFGVSGDGKTLYWTPEEGKVISMRKRRGGAGFLALGTLAQKYGDGGTDAIRTSMGLESYTSKREKRGNSAPSARKPYNAPMISSPPRMRTSPPSWPTTRLQA
ncbi:hypothetical protein RRG08_001028 [Elysia crispata]|uniref:Uncharacterized protein n=1 Tax=Elysia crispata TaxID=231223 RepID=A0AAE1E627_9GAST|nr:hypothetical protein RRG08_001028 [Elysia crispata]